MQKRLSAIARRHAELSAELLGMLKERLGSQFFTRGEDVEFILTEQGRTVIAYGELTFFLDARGQPIAGRRGGGSVEFARVTPTGMGDWIRAPVREAALN